jgi:serine/threonine-protein kinase
MPAYVLRRGLSLCLVTQVVACAPATHERPQTTRSAFAIPAGRVLRTFAVSPDGKLLAYSAENESDQRLHLYVQSIDGGSTHEIAGALGAHNPFFSPDAQWVGYFSRGTLWKAPADTGTASQKITDATSEAAGASWTTDGRIVFAPLDGHGLMTVSSEGGTPVPLTTLSAREGELEHGWPHELPGGGIVFTVSQRGRDPHLEVVSKTGGRARLQVPAIGQSQFVSSGHLVYSYLGNLLAVAFDPETSQTRGVPVVIAKGIQSETSFGNLGRSGFAVSRSGTLAWLRASPEDARSRVVRVDRTGRYVPLPIPPGVYQTPRISPDGRYLAVVARPGVMTREIRIFDGRKPERLVTTLAGGDNQSPAWMPDGRRLTFGSNRDGLQKIYVATIGRGGSRPLFSIDVSVPRNPAAWLKKPPLLALYEIDPVRRRDVMVYRVDKFVLPVAVTMANERSPVLSPDGLFMAYVSDDSGRDEIYVKPLEAAGEAIRVTDGGGTEPVWTPEGLFYRRDDQLLLAPWKNGSAQMPEEILEGSFERDPGANLAAYDVDPKRQFFIMLKRALIPRELRIVRNWGTELEQLVPAK